ncbi:MAG TPA: Smr/MutS family protein [Reyranella sp.]|nr:Smr/MutS family protein [Reyranella sp.]
MKHMARDVDLFKAAMADVKPLKGRRAVRPSPSPTLPRKTREGGISSPVIRERIKEGESKPAEPLAFDRDVDRALSRGRRSPEATLDLHGMTLAAAERAVRRFLDEAVALDMRLVLIVTGKGLRQESGRVVEGRIRAEFPGWLTRADNRAKVRGAKPAHLRHGGSGAFYVLLRRR